jgi:hypothetical protein
MNRPKYTENPMACLRDLVASAVHNRLDRLKRQADDAERLARIAREELESALVDSEAGVFGDIDVNLITGDSECWAEVCRRVKEIDEGEQWGPMSQIVHAHYADRGDFDLNLVSKIFPDFNPAPGIREGLERHKAE